MSIFNRKLSVIQTIRGQKH